MKIFRILKFISVCLLVMGKVYGQMPNQSDYQNRYSNCIAENQKLRNKLEDLREEKKMALQDLRAGYFCSKCKISKSQFEKKGEDFYTHVKDVKGEVVPASQAEIQSNQAEFSRKISNLENDVDGKRLDCERIQMDYTNSVTKANQQAAREADEKVKSEMDKADQAATATANNKAAEEQRNRDNQRIAAEAERQRREQVLQEQLAEQQRKQDQLNANMEDFGDRLAQNNSNTEDRLNNEKNNNLDGNERDNSKDQAKSQIASHDTRNIGNGAFGNDGGDLIRQAREASKIFNADLKDNLTKKFNSFVRNSINEYIDQSVDHVFSDKEMDFEEISSSGWKAVAKEIASEQIHKVSERISNLCSSCRNTYEAFKSFKKEYDIYNDSGLANLNKDHLNIINNAFVEINKEDNTEFLRNSDEELANAPEKAIYTAFKWLTNFGKGPPVQEYKDLLHD